MIAMAVREPVRVHLGGCMKHELEAVREVMCELRSRNEAVARFPTNAYVFAVELLNKIQGKLRSDNADIDCRELANEVPWFALEQFGLMAGHVLSYFKIRTEADFGRLVENLVIAELFAFGSDESRNKFRPEVDYSFLDRAKVNPDWQTGNDEEWRYIFPTQ